MPALCSEFFWSVMAFYKPLLSHYDGSDVAP